MATDIVRIIYCLLSVAGLWYVYRRNIDILSIGFGGTLVYSFPVLVFDYSVYVISIYTFTIALIVLFMIVSLRHQQSPLPAGRPDGAGQGINRGEYPPMLAFFRIVTCVLTVFFTVRFLGGLSAFSEDIIIYVRTVLVIAVCTYLFVAMVGNRRMDLIIAMVCFVPLILSGDRTQFVISMLVAAVGASLYLRITPAVIFQRYRWRAVLALVLTIIVGFFGKVLYGSYDDMLNGMQYAEAFDARIRVFFLMIDRNVESFHVVNMFNLVYLDNFYIGPGYLLHLPQIALPFSYDFDVNSHYITDLIKARYYTDWSEGTGVSANPYAEAHMAFGVIGPLVFCLGYIAGILILNRITRNLVLNYRLWASSMLIQMSVFWAFYIHRSSIFQIVAHWKRIVLVLLFIYLGYFIFRSIYLSFVISRPSSRPTSRPSSRAIMD
ncbi:MAG: hypothetical protein Q8K97_09570 [Pseudohongiella sp.]|nr:hypothetical protein [Pseudohongiella sp.]MDP2127618.1 hypothetical protein [Pseudohongiella sp.]